MKLNGMYVVTGGTGFLGVEVVKRILEEGASVRIVVRTRDDSALMHQKGVELALGDVTDDNFMEQVCRGANGVFHLAGVVDHSRTLSHKIRSFMHSSLLRALTRTVFEQDPQLLMYTA